MCVDRDDTTTLCRSLEEYVLACQEKGVNMEGWRQQTDCGKHRKKTQCGFCLKVSKAEILGIS